MHASESNFSQRGPRLEDRLLIFSDAVRALAEDTALAPGRLEAVAQRLGEILEASCAVLLLSADGLSLAPTGSVAAADQPIIVLADDPVARRVLETGEPFLAPALVDAGAAALLDLVRSAHRPSLLALHAQRHSLGLLTLARSSPASRPLDERDLALAQCLAGSVALALSHAGLLAERQREPEVQRRLSARLRARAEAAQEFSAATDDQAEAAVAKESGERAADAKYRGLLEAAPDAMVVVNERGEIVLLNVQAEKRFGYRRDELLGQQVKSIIPEGFAERLLSDGTRSAAEALAQVIGTGLELIGRRKDGSEFPLELMLSPLENADGILVTAAIRDISLRKRAEQRTKSLAAIVEASDDAIVGKTLEGVITSWNPGAQRIFGYTAEEMVGHTIRRLVPAGHEQEEPEVLDALAHGEVRHLETVRLRKDGLHIDVAITSSPVRDHSGRVVGISKVARDISAQRRAEASLKQARDAAEASSRELEAFSYSVAHDLRAPLRGMNGFAQVLLDTYGEKFDAEGRDWLQEILLNAKKMGALIDALLALSRVTRSPLRRQPVDLSALVQQAVARLRAAEPERTVEVVIEEHLHASIDPHLAQSLIDNLLDNAWKFTGKTAAACIEFGAADKDGRPSFFVRDNGSGFDMAFAGKLFAPFQRLHTAAEFPGTGIGLATVQRIVHRHGGQIWAEAAPGLGATFYVSLPATGALS